jgi:hypothetical protein
MWKYIAIVIVLSLTGCYSATTEEKKAEVSGCEIFRVELAGEYYPIFLAKCKNTATVTYNTGGKSNHRGTTITEIEQESANLDLKKAALAKLSDEEKHALGLQ